MLPFISYPQREWGLHSKTLSFSVWRVQRAGPGDTHVWLSALVIERVHIIWQNRSLFSEISFSYFHAFNLCKYVCITWIKWEKRNGSLLQLYLFIWYCMSKAEKFKYKIISCESKSKWVYSYSNTLYILDCILASW